MFVLFFLVLKQSPLHKRLWGPVRELGSLHPHANPQGPYSGKWFLSAFYLVLLFYFYAFSSSCSIGLWKIRQGLGAFFYYKELYSSITHLPHWLVYVVVIVACMAFVGLWFLMSEMWLGIWREVIVFVHGVGRVY